MTVAPSSAANPKKGGGDTNVEKSEKGREKSGWRALEVGSAAQRLR